MSMTFKGLRNRIYRFLVNHVYAGTSHFETKRILLQKMGYQIGEGTKIVGPLFCTGHLVIGKNCWIGKNLTINGNGTVSIGDNCDIAPEVTFQTGTHEIGTHQRRAGNGTNNNIHVGNGCWICVRSTVLGGVQIGDGCVIAACACVNAAVEPDTIVGGVPARVIRKLENDETIVAERHS